MLPAISNINTASICVRCVIFELLGTNLPYPSLNLAIASKISWLTKTAPIGWYAEDSAYYPIKTSRNSLQEHRAKNRIQECLKSTIYNFIQYILDGNIFNEIHTNIVKQNPGVVMDQ